MNALVEKPRKRLALCDLLLSNDYTEFYGSLELCLERRVGRPILYWTPYTFSIAFDDHLCTGASTWDSRWYGM